MAYAEARNEIAADAPTGAAAARPQSAVPVGDGLCGLAGLTAAWLAIVALKPHPLAATWLLLLATAIPMLLRELRRAPAPVAAGGERGSPLRWLAGFVVATLPFLLVHLQAMGPTWWLIAWGVVAPAFLVRFVLERARNGRTSGGFPAALGAALLPPDMRKLQALGAPARLWALKAFFVPLYGLSLFGLVQLAVTADFGTVRAWLTLAVTFAYTIDLAFGVSGYLFASNELMPTVRSTQWRLLGWVVCMLCYGPLIVHWPDLATVIHNEIGWPKLIAATPMALAGGAAMLALLGLYVSATVVFGLRFSNLSNRGIVTTGPYRLMKHPAYFAHAANAWLIALVLMPAAGIDLGLGKILVPIAASILYRMRAVTEEQHLMDDPGYAAYAAWIAQHGVLARFRRLLRLAPAAT